MDLTGCHGDLFKTANKISQGTSIVLVENSHQSSEFENFKTKFNIHFWREFPRDDVIASLSSDAIWNPAEQQL